MKKIISLAINFVLLFSVATGAFAAEATVKSDKKMSSLDEAKDAKIILSPGQSLEEMKATLKERDKQTREQILSQDESSLVAKTKSFIEKKESVENSLVAPTADNSGNSFTGYGTGQGAVLLGYEDEPQWWCSWAISAGYCHAGLFDKARYSSPTSYAIRTANTSPSNGIQWENALYWQHYDEVREMSVWTASESQKVSAVTKSTTYSGIYDAAASKSSDNAWYCSKVPYRAFLDTTGIDIDADGNIWVTPGDIRWSVNTRTITVWT
ncbi:hypothetical protein [Paenibacillus elgii]|uniref:hypothetical protein n=1 Tax=Paenibacillus elgii TaxID=189691 RepID=UPI00203C5C19|nr:hypothetical protein [Paenibacillus elgii]MCM3267851.1 hypothetical protein [Paenibacillus elgii]